MGMAATAKRSHLAMTQQFSSSLKMSYLIYVEPLHETSSRPHFIQKRRKKRNTGPVEFDEREREREREKEVMLLLFLLLLVVMVMVCVKSEVEMIDHWQ
jgi:hypothetical protein